MKQFFTLITRLLFLLFLPCLLFAQEKRDYTLFLNSGNFVPKENAQNYSKESGEYQQSVFAGRHYVVIQFTEVPSQAIKNQLTAAGVNLLDYIPNYAYTASISAAFNPGQLKSYNIRSITRFISRQKTTTNVLSGNIPPHAQKAPGTADVDILLYENLSLEKVSVALNAVGANIISSVPAFKMITVRVSKDNLPRLADLPFVQWVEFIAPPSVPENLPGRSLHRVNILNAGVRNLKGEGMNVGVWDGIAGQHLDFSPAGRLINVDAGTADFHTTHVTGTIGGRGLINPFARGMAPSANIFSYLSSGNIQARMATEIPAKTLISSNHSYHDGLGVQCGTTGASAAYSLTARNTDINLNNFPYHLHCHSAGNAQTSCANGWGTITGTGKAAKNNILVAAITSLEAMPSYSSFGPVHDGRVKPEISAMGDNVFSTYTPLNTYNTISGTSLSTPGITGTVTLLAQRYKQLNANVLPPAALIKNIVCNTAKDLGNEGPDYRFGFGSINALAAVKILEQNRYALNTIATGATNDITITVPAGASRLRVMLTWNDPAAAANAAIALVNNLDLSVITGAATTLPWVLDKFNPSVAATKAVDNVSNIEQVTVENPPAGTYTLRVQGTAITTGPSQSYALTWDVNQPYTEVIYPNGGESLNPGSTQVITWDNSGVAGTQTVEYSLNNGSSWTTISATVPAATSRLEWNVPAANTSTALIRVSSGAGTDVSNTNFNIMGTPSSLVIGAGGCTGGEVSFSWAAVANATHYDIYMLDAATGNFVILVSDITGTSFTATGLTPGAGIWFAHVAKNNTTGSVSERSNAVNGVVSSIGSPVPAASTVAVCYSGNPVLSAPCNCGTTKWYDSTGTVLLTTGATYTPTNITAPVLFKARCEDQSGVSSFVNVNVTLTSPAVYVTASTPLDFCNGDSVVLNSNTAINNAINFIKTSSQYIAVPHSTSLNLASNFTIEAWVNYSGINSTIVDKGNYNFLFQLNANGNLNKLGFYDRGGAAWIYSTDPVPQNTWAHVALTRNGNIITFYINGLASGSGTATGISQDALPMNIGRQQPSACQCNFFNGQMDELRIWNTTLTQAQIQARMRSGVPVNSIGLASYYKFDEDAGTVTADATPNGNNGTLVNAPTRVVPSAAPINTEFGNALTFVKASSQYITVPHSTSLNLGANYTIEAWINYSGLNSTIIDKGNFDYLFQVGANSNADKLGFYDRGTGTWIYSTGSVSQNAWTHVALQRTGNLISFYINSVPSGTATVSGIFQDALAMNIGRQQPSGCQCNFFNGAMDELRIWNVARTPAEIAANYYRSVAVNSPGLAAYYKFDEGTGTLTADATANGNNGTLVTAQVWQNPSGVTPPAITWTPGGARTGTLTVKTTGTYTATYNMPGGCTSNVSVNVTARAKPALGPDITLYKDCVGETTNLTGLFNTTGLFTTWNTANPISVLPGTYRLIALTAPNSSCADTANANIILEVATWTGAFNGNWHLGANWNIGKVPTAKTHVIFPPGTPVCFISANAFAASIQIKNINSVTVYTPYQLMIGGKCAELPVMDNVRIALSTSLTAYDYAADNSWVSVTQAEYNNLLTTVTASGKYGSSESYMLTTPNNGWAAGYMVGGNPNPAKVPAGNYIIAWSVKTGVLASSALNSKLKVSASQTSGYVDYGSTLPDIGNIPAYTRVFFVLKKPVVITPASPSFTAVYNVTSAFLGSTSGAGYGPEYFQGSDVSFFNSGNYGSDAYSQVICTAVRQW